MSGDGKGEATVVKSESLRKDVQQEPTAEEEERIRRRWEKLKHTIHDTDIAVHLHFVVIRGLSGERDWLTSSLLFVDEWWMMKTENYEFRGGWEDLQSSESQLGTSIFST